MAMSPASPWPGLAASDPKVETAKQLRESAERLLDEAKKLERAAKEEAKAKLPAEPKAAFWRVDVQFTAYGQKYTYLLLKSGGRWWTTGTSAVTKKFDTWADLWKWLEGPDIYAHSRLQKLAHIYGSEEIEFGEKPVIGIMDAGQKTRDRW